MSSNEDIIGQKVKKVMIIIELENGNALVAKPTEIGNIDKLVTLKDLQRALSNDEHSDDMKFMSPFVFTLDLQDAGRRWINFWEHAKENCGYTEEIEACYDSQISAFKHFFNLEED